MSSASKSPCTSFGPIFPSLRSGTLLPLPLRCRRPSLRSWGNFLCRLCGPVLLLQFITVVECFVLPVISSDHHLAIYSSLQHPSLMNLHTCILFADGLCLDEFLTSVVTVAMTFQLPFRAAYEIDHFFSDLAPVLNLACSDPEMVEKTTFLLASFVMVPDTRLSTWGFKPLLFQDSSRELASIARTLPWALKHKSLGPPG